MLSTAVVFTAVSSFASMAAPVQVTTNRIVLDSEGHSIVKDEGYENYAGPVTTLETGFENSSIILLKDARSENTKQNKSEFSGSMYESERLHPVYEVSIDATCTIPFDCYYEVNPDPWKFYPQWVNSELDFESKAGEVKRLFNQGVTEVIYEAWPGDVAVSMYDLVYRVDFKTEGRDVSGSTFYVKLVETPSATTGNAQTGATANSGEGAWVSDNNGWRVQYSDGSCLLNSWYQSPASGLWYFMGADGYMLTNTTSPDGYSVDGNGVWIQ